MTNVAHAKQSPVWSEAVQLPATTALSNDLDTDVCIVGAGIAGITTAYLLTKAGKRVVLLDDGPLAGGMTLVTTAHLSSAIDDRFVQMERWHGEEGARLAAQSHAASIDFMEALSRELKADCDFKRVDGYLFLAPDDDVATLKDELAAAHRAGLTGAEIVTHLPLQSVDSRPAIRFPNQARFHPLKYLAAVAEAVKRNGGQIFTHSHVDSVQGGDDAQVKVGEHTVKAGAIVVATNVPINNLFALHTKQAPYMSYVIGARVPRGSVLDALYWDTEEMYHYVRLQPMDADSENGEGYDLLIAGGEDHKTGQASDTESRHQRLEEWTRQRFPSIEDIEFTWGGQYMETIDGLAFIGRNPMDDDNVFVVTGDSGMGITHGTLAGMILNDLILGRKNAWVELYEPSRKTLRAGGHFLQENANVAMQYADWLTSGEVRSVDEIDFGSGAVMRQGLKKVAVYRDEQGHTTKMSAVCPHLQCIVHWNGAEKIWDCPCHGSRFDKGGNVVNGPANQDLAEVNE